ncbi:Os10g0390750 [Oryza sativa Japonica Group]|uniref:Os10g0390750 protein n=2 Tax=Oryza TaxID=4527 RepID=Q338N6_ORYSJ|nr:hypothetical protein LOC_Os10g25160 [Oryza sativa Japonica Group]BAT10666.1 Os10g0390750 [Oryza sativa Japonica Group]
MASWPQPTFPFSQEQDRAPPPLGQGRDRAQAPHPLPPSQACVPRPQALSPPPNSTSPSSSSSAGELDFMVKTELLEVAGEANLELVLAGGRRGREGWGYA